MTPYIYISLSILLLFLNTLNGNTKTFDTADWGTFQDSGATINNGTFEIPSSAESWAGFWNSKNSLFPFSFYEGGELTFNASVPDGGTANVYFVFEKAPYPDTDPSFSTSSVTISGSSETSYSLEIPSQLNNTFSSFLFFIEENDRPVNLGTVIVTENNGTPSEFYIPSNVSNYNSNFYFGQNTGNGDNIIWTQEINYNPYNNEIQDYVAGQVGLDDNNHLVLRIDRTGSNTYHSSK